MFTIRLVATLSIALAVVGSPVASARAAVPTSPPIAGSIGVRLVDAPTAAVNDPRAQMYIVDHLAPGTVITRRVEVSNGTASIARIALYPSAASIVQGSFIGAASNTANDLSNWTTVRPAVTDVIAGGQSIATVTIAVPADAAPGEQYGVVWAQVRSDQDTGGITQVTRVGIRLYVSVGPGGPPPANFAIESLTAVRSSTGLPSIVARVRNTGGRALDMSGTVQLAGGPGGLNGGPFPVELGVTLAIGAAEQVTSVLDKALPAGPWHVTITLHSGLVERSAEASLTFPDVGAGPAVPVLSQQSGGGAVAIIGIAIVVAAVASGSSFRVRRRRRSSVA